MTENHSGCANRLDAGGAQKKFGYPVSTPLGRRPIRICVEGVGKSLMLFGNKFFLADESLLQCNAQVRLNIIHDLAQRPMKVIGIALPRNSITVQKNARTGL
jgi:hypothetical protein